MAAPALRAEDLVKRYGQLEAVRAVSFEVPRGVTFGFLGPNGAGKTSTMRMIYGLAPVTEGRLEVLGLDITRSPREVKRRIGVVPQESNLDADMTARESLLTHGRFYDLTGQALRQRTDDVLAFVQLSEKADTRVEELSGGMKRRLLIARALLNDPELLVLDEPTTGLDPQSRQLLWEKIRELRAQGKTILLTTHYMEEAEKLADDLVIMDEGRIIARGRPADLIRDRIGREVLEITLPADAHAQLARDVGDAIHGHERVGRVLQLYTHDAEALLERVHALGYKPESAVLRRAVLEDVFLKLTGRRLTE